MTKSSTRLEDRLWPALLLGAVGLLVLGVQPLLYAAYVHERLIVAERLGTLAAAEISAIALGSLAGVRLLRCVSARMTGLVGLALLVAGNLLPETVSLFLTRPLAGLGGGMVVSLAAAQIAQRSNVNAASGLFLFLQATSQYAIMQGFTLFSPGSHALEVQLTLAIAALAAVPILVLVRMDSALAGEDAHKEATFPPLAGWLVLGVCALYVGAAVGIWAYLGVWLEGAGMPPTSASALLTAALGGQIAGTLLAVALGTHRYSAWQVAGSGLAMIAAIGALLAAGPAGIAGWALLIGFGFAWMVGTPALSGLLLACDPERLSLPYAASAQLLGAALVPTLVGESMTESGLNLVLGTFSGLAALAVLLVPVAMAAHRPKTSI